MTPKSVDDYIQEGIYGAKEINPEERSMFLGTFRERIELALTTGQVIAPNIYSQVENILKVKPGLEMLLNGTIAYPHLSKYIKLANQYKAPFTIVQNEEKETSIGLLLAHKTAVDKDEIFIRDETFQQEMEH